MNLSEPWCLLAIAFLATFAWRAAGTVISGHIDAEMPIFDWFTCVTQALVGGLMVRAIFLPTTVLTETALFDRSVALTAAAAVFMFTGNRVLPGVIVGILIIGGATYLRSFSG